MPPADQDEAHCSPILTAVILGSWGKKVQVGVGEAGSHNRKRRSA